MRYRQKLSSELLQLASTHFPHRNPDMLYQAGGEIAEKLLGMQLWLLDRWRLSSLLDLGHDARILAQSARVCIDLRDGADAEIPALYQGSYPNFRFFNRVKYWEFLR